MAKLWTYLLLLLLLGTVSFTSIRAEDDDDAEEDDYSEPDRAHLIIRKSFKEDLAVQGRNLTVLIEIFNGGTSSAFAVELEDSPLPAEVKLAEGALTVSYDKINVGSTVSHSYVIVPVTGDTAVYLGNGVVSYKAELDAAEKQVGYTSQAAIYVLTPVQQIQQHALTAGAYLSLGAMRTGKDWRNFAIIIGVVGGLLGINQLVKSFNTVRNKRTRQKALEALEKDD